MLRTKTRRCGLAAPVVIAAHLLLAGTCAVWVRTCTGLDSDGPARAEGPSRVLGVVRIL